MPRPESRCLCHNIILLWQRHRALLPTMPIGQSRNYLTQIMNRFYAYQYIGLETILCITVRPIIKTMYVGLSLSAEVPQSTSYACITPLGLQLVYDRTSLSALERLLKICIKLTCRRSLVHTSICSQQSICQLIDSFWLIQCQPRANRPAYNQAYAYSRTREIQRP